MGDEQRLLHDDRRLGPSRSKTGRPASSTRRVSAYAGFSRSRSTLGTSSTAVHTSTTWAAMARPTSPRYAPYEGSPLHAAYCCAFPRLARRTHTTEATSSSARTAFCTSPSEMVAFQRRLKTRTSCLARSSRLRVGEANAKPEIVAWGLRNPWRFWFTRDGSALVIGDVGANRREEIDVVRRRLFGRANLGWPWFEGTVRRARPEPDGRSVLVKPFVEYGHARKRCYSVVGGIVYRGALFPDLRGRYIFGDLCGGMWSVRLSGHGARRSLRAEPFAALGHPHEHRRER